MIRWTLVLLVCVARCVVMVAEDPPQAKPTLSRLPVREATVFKDGYAFVLHRGTLPTDAKGAVALDYLPHPVLGTFWPASFDPKARLLAVTAARRRVQVARTALTMRDLLDANINAEVMLTELLPGSPATVKQHSGRILGFLNRSSEELAATSAPNSDESLPQKGQLLLLKSADGVRVVPIEQVRGLNFPNPPRTQTNDEEFRHLLTLQFDWGGKPPTPSVDVGLAYLQRGLRWIPHYRIDLADGGRAKIQMQASILNELTDLEDVTLHLVIGVPSFQFRDTTDPIAMNQTLAQLSPYFRNDPATSNVLSNAIMTQTPRMSEVRGPGPAVGGDLGPDVAGQGKNEDLFIFTVKNVTLKKGQRMTLPVVTVEVPYEDLFTLQVPYGPPPQWSPRANPGQSEEIRRLFSAPKVQHQIRLTNRSEVPFTTAPALLLKNQRVLGQGMMTYTSPGASVDVTLTSALDIKVAKRDIETKRTPKAMQFEDTNLTRIDVKGTLTLTNLQSRPVTVEVVRFIMGQVGEPGNGGKAEMIHTVEDDDLEMPVRPAWWSYYSWPAWWHRVNGIGKFRWNVRIEPGKSAEIQYAWHYFAP